MSARPLVGVRYLRVTVQPESGPRFTCYLRDARAGSGLLTGIEVDRRGDDVVPRDHDERVHIISASLITERVAMVMHNLYGHLVERDTERVWPIGYARPGEDRTYAVERGNRFLGYVHGRKSTWSAQPESDPTVPALHRLPREHRTRKAAIGALLGSEA